jgi:DNA-binding transcriptional regulator YiaG
MTPELFAERIRSGRQRFRMSQAEFAAYVGGVSISTIRNWEKGRSIPSSKPMYERLQKGHIL